MESARIRLPAINHINKRTANQLVCQAAGRKLAPQSKGNSVKKRFAIALFTALVGALTPFTAFAGWREVEFLPPEAIATSVLAVGLFPSTDPIRRGPYYVLDAVDQRGGEVQVVADAQLGNVVSVLPVYRLGAFYGAYSALPHIIHVPDDEQSRSDDP